MLWLIALFIILALVIFRKKIAKYIRRQFKLNESLIPFYGGVTDFWSREASPDEYLVGTRFRWGRRFKRIVFITGRDGRVTPKQAYGILRFIEKNFPVDSAGARIIRHHEEYDSRNGITTVTWSFDKSPYRHGLSAGAHSQIQHEIFESFHYVLADKWPLHEDESDPNEPKSSEWIQTIRDDIRYNGWVDDNKRKRYDLPD